MVMPCGVVEPVRRSRLGKPYQLSLSCKRVEVVIYDPALKDTTFCNSKVISDLTEFKKMSDVIVANRLDDLLSDVTDKVYTRDIYFRD